ncbi:MAG: AAA family ATPase [candidate division WOR-3 bacterium]|nr:AAA family ATPase [candidate division WOR-3 bacterium]
MKIRSIRIRKYGPIREFTIDPGSFEVIFGLNEAGKTALVEVLAQILFKKTAANLRYEKPEHTAIEVEDDGHAYSLPQKKVNTELPAGDVANLMYVQASESTVFGSRGETQLWDGIKTMLSKVGAGVTFTKLDEYIFDAVDLQPVKGEWKRSKQIAIENELQRKEALALYMRKIGEVGKKESELAKLTANSNVIKRRIEEIDQYRKYMSYSELVKLHNAYRETKTVAQDYERYKYDYLTEWQKLDLERNARLGEGRKVQEIEDEVKQLERDIVVLQGVDEYITKEGLKNCTGRREAQRSQPSIAVPSIIMLLAIGLAALGIFNLVPLGPTLIFLAGAVSLFAYVLYRRHAVRRVLADSREYLKKAQSVFPEMRTIDELPDRIEKNQEELITKRTLVEEKRRIIERMAIARPVDLIEKEISLLCTKTGLAELGDLEVKLTEKRKIDDELTRLGTRLAGLLQENDPKKWERMISERKVKQPAEEPDLSAYGDLVEEQQMTQRQIDGLTREIRLFRDVEQARVDISDDHAAFVEFEELERKLSDYELEKKAAFAAREILRGMSGELDEFIQDILHGKDSLSEYFRAVTDRYVRVVVESENFKVEDRSGKTYTLESLSSGTQDQLLMCFRMAALTKVYSKGAFMILDDAFIFADWQRRERLARLLKDFVEKGNQVIYLTSDDHTRDLLAGYGARVTVLK